MIKEFEFYHGVALTKLVHNNVGRTIINPYPSLSNASYVFNEEIGLYIKHSNKRMTPWRFSFQKIHQDEILEMKNTLKEVFLLLVCGEDGIVTLSFDEIKKVLNDVHEEVEWISAARNPYKEYTVKGSDGVLGRKIGKNDFPKKVLECYKKMKEEKLSNEKYSWISEK